ncbi:YtxH-like protein [Cardinium endosymbiont of Sogatella furcifera]|uniref:YtxH domain-containing protein n=1 Tax=Cardinium endosymbiont of Sogatella furcifera TaxID=650378 RepID=UPI000E0CFA04|nr:YtxH domain-containing protein [Cardinium endosymbiont of Sogatella furcifera]AXI23972.1 YtxH-like protein [Cardinium endosymbiont of Sogatella furcifera]
MIKRTENILILCLGFCLGAFVGIFAAPTKGSVARDGMLYNLKSCKKKLQAFMLKLMGNKHAFTNEAKTTGKEVITDVVSAAQQILKELELIATQLEQKTK